MSNKKLDRALRKSNKKKEDKVIMLSGQLGIPLNGQKLVEVPNRQGFVFVRLKNNTSELIQAYNNAVSPIYDLPVLLARQTNGYRVIGRNIDRYTNQWGQAPYLPKHGAQHSFNPDLNIGGDIVWVYSQQFMPLLGYPSGSAGSPRLAISPYIIQDLNGNWKYVGGTGTPDTTPYNPTTGSRSIMGLLYIDTMSGNPAWLINSGTYFDSSLTGSNDITQYIPRPTDASQLPISAVRLVSGTSILTWDNVYDVRPFLRVIPTGTTSSGNIGSGLGFVAWDEGIFLGTGTVLNFVGAGVTATISGSVINVNVPNSGGAVTGSVTIWESGIFKGSPAVLDLRNNLSTTVSGTVISIDAMPGLYDVTHYGASGNGTTDDTEAINRAISAIPASGGVLYFPPGAYRTTGSHSISNPTTIMGMGSGDFNGTGSVSSIYCYSPTANLFLVSADKTLFKDVALKNVSTSTPSAGAGISVQSSSRFQRADYENVSVYGFYINVDVQTGQQWYMHGCYNSAPVLYGMKIRNTVNGDAGDWSISDCVFDSQLYAASAAIRQESSGGGKITNVKINQGSDSFKFVDGIELQITSNTGLLQVSNISIENVTGIGINIANDPGITFGAINISNCEFGMYGNSTFPAIKIAANALGNIDTINIIGNNFFAGTASCAIQLTNIDRATVFGNTNKTFGSTLCQTNCTNVSSEVSIALLDEGIPQGNISAINFVGAGVTASALNFTGTVTIPGGGSSSQGIVVYDDGNYFASGTQISFDNNLYLGLSGTIVHVSSPISTYQRVEQPILIAGSLFQVPDGVYASGSLGVFYNGLIQYKGRDYEELLYSSGTYQLLFSPATGSTHMVSYGVPCISQPFVGATGTNIMTDSFSNLLLDSFGTQIVDSNG